jgi:hypothetical protein
MILPDAWKSEDESADKTVEDVRLEAAKLDMMILEDDVMLGRIGKRFSKL